MVASVSEDHIAFMFKVQMKMEVIASCTVLVITNQATHCGSPAHHNLNCNSHENLRDHIEFCYVCFCILKPAVECAFEKCIGTNVGTILFV